MTAPTPETLAEVERMLPCNYEGEWRTSRTAKCNSSRCPCNLRPTVAQALQVYKDRVRELEAEISARRVGWHKSSTGEGWCFVKAEETGGWTCHAETWVQLCKSQGIEPGSTLAQKETEKS